MNPNLIAQTILGEIDWQDLNVGFLQCPGMDLHSNPSNKRECRVTLDGAPTIFCVHTSCAGVIAEKNFALRSAIAKAERGANPDCKPWRPSPADIQRKRERAELERLTMRAEKSLDSILDDWAFDLADFWEASPHKLDGHAVDDWRLLLQLFEPTDVVWIGDLKDSGPGFEDHFRTAAQWLQEENQPPGQHVCPSAFKPGVCSRSKENIAARRSLVVESDVLSKPDFCAVLCWLQNRLHLRAIVDTGNKSLHGWFDIPDPHDLREMGAILPALGCDVAMLSPAHTCRLPGPVRAETGKRQHLAFLDPKGTK